MTNAQITGMRQMHEGTKKDSFAKEITARCMAMTPHWLSRDGMTAAMSDGKIYAWDDTRQAWVFWEKR